MKLKLICLLAVLFGFSLAASPNRCCNGICSSGKKVTQAATTPAKVVTMMIDDLELLPIHQHFSNF